MIALDPRNANFDTSKFTPQQLELMQGGGFAPVTDMGYTNVANLPKPANQRVYDPNLPLSATNMPMDETQDAFAVLPQQGGFAPAMQPLYSQATQTRMLNGVANTDQPFVASNVRPAGFNYNNELGGNSAMAMSGAPTANPAPPAMTQSPAPTSSNIDPAIQPYLGYGLSEAQRLYQAGGPQYYGGQTYVSPSTTTQTGLQALEARAKLGNPLLQSAQNQLQSTVSGEFLGGNPFFQGAFAPAAKAAESQFKQTLGDVAGKASLAGRYGSGAMGSLQDRATGAFSQSLANTAGQLAYQNYDAERARQQAATLASPAMASADYQDIQQLLTAGQAREGYTGQQQQADIQRFNFLQNQPQQNLQTYLQSVYGNPINKAQQVQDTSPSGLQNLLGTAATLAGIEGKTNWLSKGWNVLTGP